MDSLVAVAARADQLVETGDVLDAFNLLLTGLDVARETSEDDAYAQWDAAVRAFARKHGIRLH